MITVYVWYPDESSVHGQVMHLNENNSTIQIALPVVGVDIGADAEDYAYAFKSLHLPIVDVQHAGKHYKVAHDPFADNVDYEAMAILFGWVKADQYIGCPDCVGAPMMDYIATKNQHFCKACFTVFADELLFQKAKAKQSFKPLSSHASGLAYDADYYSINDLIAYDMANKLDEQIAEAKKLGKFYAESLLSKQYGKTKPIKTYRERAAVEFDFEYIPDESLWTGSDGVL